MVPHNVRRTLPWIFCFAVVGPAVAFEDSAVQVEPLAKSAESWNGTLLPAYPAGQPEITVLRIRIAPGARLPMHEHPVVNAAVMLAGDLTVVTEAGRTLRLRQGDAIVEVVDQWHYGYNDGTEFADLIVFYAGVQGQPITVNR
jgi:quercetin dioxygenase-like cupin family protein